MKGQPIFSDCFKAHEHGLKTVQPGVCAFNGGTLPVKLGIQVRVFGVFAFAGTGVPDNVGLDATPETIVA